MTTDKLQRVPIPCHGASKYRPIAKQILDAFAHNEALVLPMEFDKRRAEIKRQIDMLVHHKTGQWPTFRLQTKQSDLGTVAWIATVSEESRDLILSAIPLAKEPKP